MTRIFGALTGLAPESFCFRFSWNLVGWLICYLGCWVDFLLGHSMDDINDLLGIWIFTAIIR